ncbi:ABC transporter permease [Pseudonocardia parietis]|uniref:ABC-2 type transport system permease protein n=1 Tax=Pseudonocardia parietis TaxID=570936 RepID=A0ABS4VL48_9PSEU|nr:ABC transporter permease [Pseudonocardia parietis]MBP2364630.1 ABC-2 type transport system permease protein [Pseudonocardia parietis]
MSAPAAPRPAAGLVVAHVRYLVLEQLRIPIAVLSSALFPALSLLFFVLPFDWADEPGAATAAVAQLALFGVLTGFLFTFGVGVADDREKPWDPYLRTLPAPAWARIVARLVSGSFFALLAVLPVLAVGALFTAATVPSGRLLAAIGTLVLGGLPFLLGGLAIGYSLPPKAALPVVQLIFFPMAFGGGLLVPPALFPDWMQTVSSMLPTRGARDLLIFSLGGPAPGALAVLAFTGWTVTTALLAVWAYRRDEGRRFR